MRSSSENFAKCYITPEKNCNIFKKKYENAVFLLNFECVELDLKACCNHWLVNDLHCTTLTACSGKLFLPF